MLLSHWTCDSLQKSRIERVFPLMEVLHAPPVVTDAALLKVLLCDLYKANKGLPLAPPFVGSSKVPSHLPHLWKSWQQEMPFQYHTPLGVPGVWWSELGKMLWSAGLLGFQELKIRYFPAVSFRDYRGTKRIYWKANEYVEVLYANQTPSPVARAVAVTRDVCLEIERRSLSYSRNLDKYKELGMPWMEAVLRRLDRDHLKMTAFLSCAGMLMNGDFVTYEHLKTLSVEMPISQAQLQTLQIQYY